MIVSRSRLLTAALAAACAPALSCGGGSPAASTPPAAVAPTPTPTPGTGGGVGASSCPIGVGSAAAECSRGDSRLLERIEVAIDLTVRQKPGIFDLTSDAVPGSGQYRVLDPEAYLDGVVANLQAAGLCAQRNPDDTERVQVKESNDYSEDFDILVSSGFIRRGNGAYRETCTPSSFPVERGADEPPLSSGCGRPFPPPVTRFNCKVHLKGVDYHTLDSTPIVGPDCAYCASVGFVDQCLCAVRVHGAPDRVACENWLVGTARDTGRPGPTWTKEDGGYCTGPESGCANSADSQYQLLAYKGGRYKVEAGNGASCTVVVER